MHIKLKGALVADAAMQARRHRIQPFNTLRPKQNIRDFANVIFKCNLLNENI